MIQRSVATSWVQGASGSHGGRPVVVTWAGHSQQAQDYSSYMRQIRGKPAGPIDRGFHSHCCFHLILSSSAEYHRIK